MKTKKKMTKREARALEARLTADKVHIPQRGTIRITDVDSGVSETHLTYAAADILWYINRGYKMSRIIEILNEKAAN